MRTTVSDSRFWISCRDATRLLDTPEPLTARSRLGLWFHLLICYACRVYRAQIEALKESCRRAHGENAPSAEVVRAVEDRVLEVLSKKPE